MNDLLSFFTLLIKEWILWMSSIIALLVYWWYRKKKKELSITIYVKIAVCVAFIACFFVWQSEHRARMELKQQIETQQSIDQVIHNRPYLDAELVIDAVSSGDIAYHFEIENKGKLRASSILQRQIVGDFSGGDMWPEFIRELSPGAKMTLRPPMPTRAMNGAFHLALAYTTELQGTNIPFTAAFHYFVPPALLQPGRFFYDSCESEIRIDQVRDPNAPAKALSGPTGTLYLPIREVVSGKPGKIVIRSDQRLLHFDPIERIVIFKSVISEGREVVLSRPVKETAGGRHIIIVTWSTNGALLLVDGDKTWEPKEYAK